MHRMMKFQKPWQQVRRAGGRTKDTTTNTVQVLLILMIGNHDFRPAEFIIVHLEALLITEGREGGPNRKNK